MHDPVEKRPGAPQHISHTHPHKTLEDELKKLGCDEIGPPSRALSEVSPLNPDDANRGIFASPLETLKTHARDFQQRADFIYSSLKLSIQNHSLAQIAQSMTPTAALSHLNNRINPSQSIPGTATICALELGGTTCRICITSTLDLFDLSRQATVKTEGPKTTLAAIFNWIRFENTPIHMFCIGSFGPIDPNPFSPTYGYITNTPKTKWKNFDIVGAFKQEFGQNIIVSFNSDVHGPAITELIAGDHGDHILQTAYITIGTGIGVGFSEKTYRSYEGGHIYVKRHPQDTFKGACDLHQDCLEGLAAGSAIAARFSSDMSELVNIPDEDPVWDIVAYYLAQLCFSLTLLNSPDVIILGGGLMLRTILFDLVRKHFVVLNNSYQKINVPVDKYIVPSKFGNNIGLLGTIQLYKNYTF